MEKQDNQFTKLTQEAYDSVKELAATNEFKLAGFKLVLGALLGGQTPIQVPSQGIATGAPTAGAVPTPPAPSDWQAKIASKMDISVDEVLEIYHLTSENQLELVIESKDLPKTTSKSAQHIASLLSAGRQALDLERATPLEEIRKVCDAFRVYDSKNFSASMKQLGSKFRFEGSGNDRSIELINGAYKIVSEIAKKYIEKK